MRLFRVTERISQCSWLVFVYYLLLFLFIHTIFQDSKGQISYRMRQWFYRHYMIRRFWKREDGKQNGHPEKTLLLCALAYRFPKKSDTDLLEMMRERLNRLDLKHPGRIGKRSSKKTGPDYNNALFEYAAKLAKVGEIQVLVVKTSKVYKFHLDGSNSEKVMQVHCKNDTVKHPSYFLQFALQ